MPDKVSITKQKLDDLANAVGSKSGIGVPLTIDQMTNAVLDIKTDPRTQDKTVNPSMQKQVVTADSGYDALGSVTVTPVAIQAKTATPTESQQVIEPDTGYDGLSSVTVGAISNTYVGSAVDRNDSTDLTANGATVTAPAGYYAEDATKTVAAGSATTPATTITANPTISVNAVTGLITATASASQSVTPTVSEGYVTAGMAGTVTVSGNSTQQLTTKTAATYTPGTTAQTIAAGQYLTGAQTIAPIPSEYIVPTGTTTITENGTVDVTQYASAEVNVPAPEPEGVKYIWTDKDGEGAWDVGGYKYCAVDGAPVNDGHSRVWINLTDSENLTFSVKMAYALNGSSLIIDWGDGNVETITSGNIHTHTYSETGKYIIDISGSGTGAAFGEYALNQTSDTTMRTKALYIEFNSAQNFTWSTSSYFRNLFSVKKVFIGDHVRLSNNKIPDYSFYYCSSLVDVNIPDSTTSIGDYAFQNCTSLAPTSLPSSLTTIGDYAFRDCTSLAITSLPSSLTKIGNGAFRNCTSLALVSVPDGVTWISGGSFWGCTSLALVSLPSGIQGMGANVFYQCGSTTNKLTVTILATTPPSLGSSAFTKSTLNKIYVPAESVADYKAATNWSAYADYIEAIPS